jgi:hypothetical protein
LPFGSIDRRSAWILSGKEKHVPANIRSGMSGAKCNRTILEEEGRKGRKVFLIVDRYSSHEAKKVEEWLVEHDDKIRPFLPPSYNPALNPGELANQDIKRYIFRDGKDKDKLGLLGKLRDFLRSRQRLPHKVKKDIDEKDVAYGKAGY